jgi:hypothetical protein
MAARYGAPASVKDFSDKMQLVNANGYRGIFEAAGHKLNETGGVMLWKLNAAFPSVIWQVYDWYLNPNAGYYFMQRACEPVHIQLNLDDSTVAVVNRSYKSESHLSAEIKVFDLQSKLLFSQAKTINVNASNMAPSISLSEILSKEQGISFVVLVLKNAAGKVISHNTYWFSPNHDFKNLKDLSASNLSVKILKKESSETATSYVFEFTNTSQKIAFFINPQIVVDGKEVLPTFWSDNYFSLSPNEATTVRVSIPAKMIKDANPQLALSAWNVAKKTYDLN